MDGIVLTMDLLLETLRPVQERYVALVLLSNQVTAEELGTKAL
jgi:hypothetical protein